MFKFYYQAWILLAAASAFGVYYLASRWDWLGIYRRTVGTVAVGLIGLLIVASAMFTLGALNNKTNSFSADPTLHGLAFLGGPESPETRALAFISEDSGPESVIVEAVAVDDRGHAWRRLQARLCACVGAHRYADNSWLGRARRTVAREPTRVPGEGRGRESDLHGGRCLGGRDFA